MSSTLKADILENRAFDNSGKAIQKFDDVSGRGHLENFIESIQTGKQLYTSKVHHGHWSAALGHMANTSLQNWKTANQEDIKNS